MWTLHLLPGEEKRELREILVDSQFLLVMLVAYRGERSSYISRSASRLKEKFGIDARLVVMVAVHYRKIEKGCSRLPVTFYGIHRKPRKNRGYSLCGADVSSCAWPLETFCLSALESLSCGTPVVANSRSAVGELLDENGSKKCGATAKDEFEFAEKITSILRGPSLRLAARNRALEYSWDRTVQELLKLGNAEIAGARAA